MNVGAKVTHGDELIGSMNAGGECCTEVKRGEVTNVFTKWRKCSESVCEYAENRLWKEGRFRHVKPTLNYAVHYIHTLMT